MNRRAPSRSDRIAIEEQLHDIYRQLSSGSDPEFAPFEELKDVFLMAACLGFQRGKRRELSSERRDVVRWETLSQETDVPVLHAIALADAGAVDVLQDRGEVLTIAEEYANEGIHQLVANIMDHEVRPLWQLVEMIRTEAEPPDREPLSGMLDGENDSLEYKASMRWDLKTKQVNRDLELAVAKSVAAFLNSHGGTLLIGVADDGGVVGIEDDLRTLGRRDRDGYEQKFREVLNRLLGTEFSGYQRVSFRESSGKIVCVVQVEPSTKPVYLKQGPSKGQKATKEFYVRSGNTTQPLDMQTAHDYISMHWPT